eukprot:CAMPEP_0184302386 /NCGR_PEP_ID=MMETSP1049-20130417/12381_1 /TAXON_ID=77928 /ORGANISM="Proteomonas sulcata, Strain CCMP704" /LENGTH=109 /DNA_ID=CAMNT_0026613669 /DNA_START=94 /DNA_END=423 /DNA_ORIENTATION=+
MIRKRSAEDEVVNSPAKRIRQYFKEGYMEHGPAWAEHQFAAASQQGAFAGASVDHMLPDVPEQNQGPISENQEMGMEVDINSKENEWWSWWSNKWSVGAQPIVVDPMGR